MSDPLERRLFHEQQAFTQWWVWAIVFLVAVLAWWTFVQQILQGVPFGTQPASDTVVWAIFLLCGLGLPLFFVRCRLLTTVTPASLRIHYRLLRHRLLPIPDIRSCRSIVYRPMRQYGGWGIRYNRQLGWAYTAHGNRGVHLRLADGSQLLVGSQRPGELAAALHEAGVPYAEPADAGGGA